MLKNAKPAWLSLFLIVPLFLVIIFFFQQSKNDEVVKTSRSPSSVIESDIYLSKVQSVFNARCVACHSCYNSPCQLDLTSYEGLSRGASKTDMYDFRLLHQRAPTRLGIDGTTVADWRKKEFFSVVPDSVESLDNFEKTSALWRLINMKDRAMSYKNKNVYFEPSRMCPNANSRSTENELDNFVRSFPVYGMPYGLPPLNDQELRSIAEWFKLGAPGPSVEAQAALKSVEDFKKEIEMFESFFNATDAKAKLTARYIYEHLFIAHIYFKNKPKYFFRLVRATNQYGDPKEIPTPRPYDDPGQPFFYRFKKYTATIVQKNHIPYELSEKKLNTWKINFLESSWETNASQPPKYGLEGANPFTTFYDIPAAARNRFLLDDAYYHIMTFVKGPVCNGQTATNVIEDNFWVLFVDPTKDVTVNSPEFFQNNAANMDLPAEFPEGEVEIDDIRKKNLLVNNNKYRLYKENFPDGIDTKIIWDGDQTNDNALLTIYRHNNSAAVLKGAHGQVPKTIWLLDYPLFEDIYYNLVAGYNVFGSVSHQVITRKHMDHSRVDATDLFISLFPAELRMQIRNQWTKEAPLEEIKVSQLIVKALLQKSVKKRMESEKPYLGINLPSKVKFNSNDLKKELIDKIFFERFTSQVRGEPDFINNCSHCTRQLEENITNFSQVENWLGTISGHAEPFSVHLPDVAYLRVTLPDGKAKAYTLVHNREHYNVSFLLSEQARLDKKNDSINFVAGYAASYPNIYFDVKAKEIPLFIQSLKTLNGKKQSWESLLKRFAVLRSSSSFWSFHDWLNEDIMRVEPIEGGKLDLNRYTGDL